MKNKFWIILVVILILLNLFSIGALWKTRGISRGDFSTRKPSPDRYMMKRLDFSPEQHDMLMQMRTAHFKQIRPLEEELRSLRSSLFTTATDSSSQINPSALLQEIGAIQRQVDSLTFIHFQEIKRICTSEQANRFSRFMEEMAERRFGAHHPGKHSRRLMPLEQKTPQN